MLLDLSFQTAGNISCETTAGKKKELADHINHW